jgi:hypothetical protein
MMPSPNSSSISAFQAGAVDHDELGTARRLLLPRPWHRRPGLLDWVELPWSARMDSEPDAAARRPKGRSLADFPLPELSAAEKVLLERCGTSEPAQFGATRPTAPSDDNRIGPGFLRFLALGGDAATPVHEKGLQIEGAWIEGTIDFEGCILPHRLRLASCHIEGALCLRDAQLVSLDLEDTFVRGIIGTRLRCTGTLLFWHKFHSCGGVLLSGAKIDGNFDCEGGRFADDDVALDCFGTQFGGRVFLNKGFEAIGSVKLSIASLQRGLDCRGGRFAPPGDVVLDCARADVTGSVLLGEGFHANGEVRMVGANITGELGCGGGQFVHPDKVALNCTGTTIGGHVLLCRQRDGARFEATGEVQFPGAKIGGDLNCVGGKFSHPEKVALNCDGATIGGRVFLQRQKNGPRFEATGEVRFLGAKIAGVLNCGGGRFSWCADPANPGGPAAVPAPAAAAAAAPPAVPAAAPPGPGQVPSKDALSCDGAEIGADIVLNSGFHATGTTKLVGVRVGGEIDCTEGRFENPGGFALVCQRAEIKGGLFFTEICGIAGKISLTGTHVAALIDDVDSWKAGVELNLDGFTYARFGEDSRVDAVTRRTWLCKQEKGDLEAKFKPQPWLQVARVLYAMGHEEDAKQIRVEMRKRWRRSLWRYRDTCGARLGWALRTRFDWLLGGLVGYGYRPWRIILGFAVVYLIGVLVFETAPSGVMVPVDAKTFLAKGVPPQCTADWMTFAGPPLPSNARMQGASDAEQAETAWRINDDASQRARAAVKFGVVPATSATWPQICARAVPPEYVTFDPLLYSLELLIPVLDLRQKARWTPRAFDENGALVAHGLGGMVWLWRWFETLAVLFFSLLLVASVSGIIKKE